MGGTLTWVSGVHRLLSTTPRGLERQPAILLAHARCWVLRDRAPRTLASGEIREGRAAGSGAGSWFLGLPS